MTVLGAAGGRDYQGTPDATGRNWTLWNQDSVVAPMVQDVANARDVVNIEFLAFNDHGKGAELVDAAEFAARRGREVNVFTDMSALPSLPLGSYQRLARDIERAGGDVRTNLVGRLTGGRIGGPAQAHVDHRKAVVVDGGRVSWTGGQNFNSLTDAYEDTMVRMTGRPGAALGADQLDRWRRIGGDVSARHVGAVQAALGAAELEPIHADDLHLRVNAPDQGRFELSDDYDSALRTAKERLWVSSGMYTDGDQMRLLEAAAGRGVDVRVVGSQKPPLFMAPLEWAAESHQRPIASAGGSVHLIPGVLHRKGLVADDSAIVSSYNVTKRSYRADHELGIRSTDPAFVRAVENTLLENMGRAVRLDPTSAPSLGVRAASLVTRALRISY